MPAFGNRTVTNYNGQEELTAEEVIPFKKIFFLILLLIFIIFENCLLQCINHLSPQVYQYFSCLKERGAQRSNFSSNKRYPGAVIHPNPDYHKGPCDKSIYGGRQEGEHRTGTPTNPYFWQDPLLQISRKWESFRCLIMHTPSLTECNIRATYQQFTQHAAPSLLSPHFHSHLSRFTFYPWVSSSFFSCQVELLHPSNPHIPCHLAKTFSMQHPISGPSISTPKLRIFILPFSYYYFPTVFLTLGI